MLVMGLAGSSMSSIRGGDILDTSRFRVDFVECLVCIIGNCGVDCSNRLLKWFFSFERETKYMIGVSGRNLIPKLLRFVKGWEEGI
jgi:hypothetical protein